MDVVLIAIACAGLWYGGKGVVKGAKKAGHAIERPFKHQKPAATK